MIFYFLYKMENRVLLIFFLFFTHILTAQSLPEAHKLSNEPYYLGAWSSNEEAGTYPPSMIFQEFIAGEEPNANSEPVADWKCTYDIKTRSRFAGLGEQGIGIINTGSEQDDTTRCGNENHLGGRVGIVSLALNTQQSQNIEISWKVRMIEEADGFPNPRDYRLSVQYRISKNGTWINLPETYTYGSLGKTAGDVQEYYLQLPFECEDQEYVQIRWKYYQQSSNNGGSRPLIALDDIKAFGFNIASPNPPYVFTSKSSLLQLNCMNGNYSEVDSMVISGINLSSKVTFSTEGDFSISLSKDAGFTNTIELTPVNSQLSDYTIYVRKLCSRTGVENGNINIVSTGLSKKMSLRGEGYVQMYINELMSSNFQYYRYPSIDDYPDWLELYNPNDVNVDLQNYFLSDDKDNLKKVIITSPFRITSKSYRVYYPVGRNNLNLNLVDFSLSNNGETVYLVGKDGKTILDSVTYPRLTSDFSYGREYDGADKWVIFSSPTREFSNSMGVIALDKSAPPTFSHESGFFDETFLLNLSTENPEAKIYYTLDGSNPDPNNLGGFVYEYKQNYPPNSLYLFVGDSYFRPYRSYIYSNPIDFSLFRTKSFWMSDINATYSAVPLMPKKRNFANVVRAIAVEPGKAPSEIISYTYFFNHDEDKDSLPIISMVLNEESFKGFYNGIGVAGVDYESWRLKSEIGTNHLSPANYKRSGRSAEIPVNFELFVNKKSLINQVVGARIHGNASRTYAHKSMRIYAREVYGKSQITYPFFDQLPYEDFSRFILRNSGNDFIGTYFKDAYTSQLLSFTRIDFQEYQPYNVYINGEYWGLMNARERIDINYFKRKYGFDDENIDVLEKKGIVLEGDDSKFQELVNYIISQDVNTDESYQYLIQNIDVDNFLDYFILKTYAAVIDWPLNNNKYWRYKTTYKAKAPYGLDGRWRWVDYDNDSGYNLDSIEIDMIDKMLNSDTLILFSFIIKNDKIKQQFITRYADFFNSSFKKDRCFTLIDQFQKRIEYDYVKHHLDRWPVINEIKWRTSIDELKQFAERRPDICIGHLRNSFALSEMTTVQLDVDDYNKGHIKVNTIEVDQKLPGVDTMNIYPWSGNYFKNFPITFIPVPHDGYKFSYWEFPDSTSLIDTIQFDLTKPIQVKAYFEIDKNYTYYPEAAKINVCPFEFTEWNRRHPVGEMPEHIAFYYTRYPDSKYNGPIEGKLEDIRYDHDSQTRINGLGKDGISFVNAGGANDNYFETRLGAMVVAINTENIPGAYLSFTAGTVKPQSKKYSLRLQYRLSDKGEFFDFSDTKGQLVEYHGTREADDVKRFDKIELPKYLIGKKYVQLAWRYYYNGEQVDMGSNARDELRIDDIKIQQKDIAMILTNDPYKSTLVGNPNSQSFQWYVCENDSIVPLSGETKKELTIYQPGYYAVEVDYGDCKYISECEYIFVKERKDFVASIHSIVYPNPTNGSFDLIFDEEMSQVKIIVLDITGRSVDERYFEKTQNVSYHLNHLSNGVYLLDISTLDGRKSSQKFLVQR